MTTLKGMTWSHPRGYDPMVACSAEWQRLTGVTIEWEKRSLQDFESYPVEDLAQAYDLIVIDHPHVGQITREGCIAPLDVPGREAERQALEAGSVGPSYRSYNWQGRQWGFPIDAATQVLAWRPDLIAAAPTTWEAVMDLARQGRVMLPLRPPHSVMTFYTLAGNLGHPCNVTGDTLIDTETGTRVWQMMQALYDLLDPACAQMDPIAVFEEMAKPGSPIACAPLIYGYINYALPGFRPNPILFADIAVAGTAGPIGSGLGGTGIAVSARSAHVSEAMDFAYWVASGAGAKRPLRPLWRSGRSRSGVGGCRRQCRLQ